MADILNPLAEVDAPDSGRYATPDEAKSDRSRKYFCPDSDCLDKLRRLIFKTSKNGISFFCHYPDFQHEISPETLLHKLTIKSFEGLKEFELPSFKNDEGNYYPVQLISIDLTKTILEFRELKGIRPDVTVTSLTGMQFAIEIFVTHRTKENKIQRLEDHKLPTIEIDLKDFYYLNRERCKTDIRFIKENAPLLVSDLNRKNWLAKPKPEQIVDLIKREEAVVIVSPPSTTSPSQGSLLLLIFPIVGLILIELL
jgi:hypothetical protein